MHAYWQYIVDTFMMRFCQSEAHHYLALQQALLVKIPTKAE